jgi:response regulator RpfG family c-di-GMP phosphodiesterase
MDLIAAVVLAGSIAATLWLFYYVKVFLPSQFEERMRESLRAFGMAVELRFPCHDGLSTRVIALSQAIGKRLHLSRAQLRDLEMAGRLRDIGLCALPYNLVNSKDVLDWTPAEMATYDRHSEVSGAMLELIPSLRHLADIVRYHHLRYAGPGEMGVPRGEEIPVEARILKAVTEYVWDERFFGAAAAHRNLVKGRATVYCPQTVDMLLSVLTSVRVDEPRESVAV